MIKILGIAGSLRRDSYNKLALIAAQKLVPNNATIEIFDLLGIPPFNQDEEKNMPKRVVEFKEKIKSSDAILFVTPEYNYSVPGVLKNAIDWGSRPYGESAWDKKPVAIMGASPGLFGTARAQYHLRQMLVFLNMYPINRPEVMIGHADKAFDEKGNLINETSKKLIKELLENLVQWTIKLR